MNLEERQAAVEAALFAHAEPLSAARLAEILELEETEVLYSIHALQQQYAEAKHGICLLKLEDKWQFSTKNEWALVVKKALDSGRKNPLSPAALETLAIIAYNQPVSRSFIEQVRGVDSSSSVAGLLDKGLIEEAGRLDLPGRPVAFRTTDVFLRCFGLESIQELPKPYDEEQLPLEQLSLTGVLPENTEPDSQDH